MHLKLPQYFHSGLLWSRWYLMINCMAVFKGGEQNLKERDYFFIIGVLFIIIISARLCIPSTNKITWEFFLLPVNFIHKSSNLSEKLYSMKLEGVQRKLSKPLVCSDLVGL